MTATKGNVIHLYQRDPDEALERLNRVTGLRFSCWPQSLINPEAATEPSENAARTAAKAKCEVAAGLVG